MEVKFNMRDLLKYKNMRPTVTEQQIYLEIYNERKKSNFILRWKS